IAKTREADERAQLMIENTPLTVMVWNKDIQILDCNEEAVKTFGLSSKQEYIDRFFSLAPEYQPNGMTSQDMIQKEITKTFQTGYAYFEWMHHHGVTGEDIPFQITWIRVNYKGEIAAVSYAQDLRELRAAISKIREADERAQIMFDVAPYACCMYDKNGDMIDCNQEIVNMFGLKDKESYFKRASELSPEYQPDGELSSVKADRNGSLAIEKGIHRFEWLHRRLSGELFPAEITMVRVNYKGEYAVAGYIRDLTEQKAKENLTKEVMEKTTTLTAILDTAPDLIFVKDLESRYIQCNKSFEALMGCSCENIIGKDDAEGLNAPPEVAAAFVAEDKKIFDKKKMVSFEDHIIAADGSKVLFETVKSPLIVNGKMTGLVGIARDITKRKEMEKELLRHHALMDTVNAAAAVLLEPDTDGGINSINRSMEMVCQKMDVDRVYLWENVKKGNDELSFRQIHKWISPDYPLDSNLTEFSCGNLPYWNSQFAERKSINGPIDSFPEAEQEFLSQQEIQSILAVPLFFKEELWGFVSFDDCRKSHLFSKADEHTLSSWGLLVIGAIQRGKIMLDLEHAVSEAKRASSEAMKAYAQAEHALEAKSRFIANMNHEMRTPMNVIVGLTDLMMEEKGVPEKVKETLVKINIAGDTLMGLISDVLDISKAEAGKMDLIPVQYDVASMLNDVITLSTIRAEDKPITFKLDIHEDMFESLYGDELRVKQILNNLLSNAFKYTKKGEVTLGVSCQHDGEAVWLSFYVEDTGIGIRKEDIGRLFSDYSQVDTKANRKIDGTGLGLSITKKFVDIMDGEISVKSDYGRGTVFSARVRQGFVTDKVISKETVKSLSSLRYLDDKKKAQKKLERADLSYARVLVVDDFPTNLDVAAGMLRKYKMQVDCVMSGQESVDAIARGKPVYNAIFMDHMMPEMDGVEAVKLIRALKTDYAKNISIIALTANAVAESEKMFLENGFDAFLPKPFNTMSLDSVVQRWVRDKTKEG
ncbi:MAG: PAS domain S-box protein, partial [Treponema sp.]|nr:PAS domain S-box protein [Treponema sp.]